MDMSKELRNNPININHNVWYYEEKAGICIVYQLYIPWKRILESVRRKYPTEFKKS